MNEVVLQEMSVKELLNNNSTLSEPSHYLLT